MSSHNPLQTGRVTDECVSKVRVHAALVKQGEEWVIHADGGHSLEPISCKVRRQAYATKRRIIVADARGVHAVHTKAARQQCRRSDGPVVLRATVLGVRQVNIAITVVAYHGWCGGFVVMATVTTAYPVLGRDLMIQFDIELPARIFTDDDFSPVGIRIGRARYVLVRI